MKNVLNTVKVKAGDAAFIPAGRIHAILKGVFLAEIQQSSDLTYRIFDWDRKDLNNNYRQLHTEQAKDVVDLNKHKNYLINYDLKNNDSVNLCKNKYFTVNLIDFDKSIIKNYQSQDSFIIFVCTSGNFNIKYKQGEISLNKGETVLVPACINEIELITNGRSETLEIYI